MLNLDNIIFNNPSQIVLYPNPTSSNTTLGINLKEDSKIGVVIRNITGQIVVQENYETMNGMNSLNLKTNSLASGIYTVEVRLNNSTEVLKLTIN